MTGDSYRPRLERVMVLAMTATRSRQSPTVELDLLDSVSYLHLTILQLLRILL